MNDGQKLFSTYDLNLSAVLVAHGFSLAEVHKSEGGKAQFQFEQSEKLTALIDRYWQGKVRMNPQTLFTSIKSIKNRLYSNYS